MSLPLSRDVMLGRMLAADPAFDGRFLTGVLSTGIYCLPSCRARKPRPENVVFHDSPRSARQAGLRPCRRCKPDDFYAGIDADEVRVDALVAQVSPGEIRNVAHLARVAGVSSSKLYELFRVHLHTTPAEWLTRQRLGAARRLLLASSRPVAEIAFEVGFESLSTFGEQFRRWNALTPQAYRRMPQDRTLRLALPVDYPLSATLAFLGRDARDPTSRVEGRTYLTALRLTSGPLALRVVFTPEAAICTVVSGSPEPDWGELYETLLRVLGLTADPARFEAQVAADPALAPLLHGQRGLRLPLHADLFGGLLWAIVGQQVTFAFACQLRRRVVERTSTVIGEGLYAPPSPSAVAALEESDLVAMGLTRARAACLVGVSRRVASGELSLDALARGTATRAERTLLALPGLGPWSANYVMLRTFGFQDALPVGDTALGTELQRFFALESRPGRAGTLALMSRFAPYRGLATAHFWHRFQTRKEPRP